MKMSVADAARVATAGLQRGTSSCESDSMPDGKVADFCQPGQAQSVRKSQRKAMESGYLASRLKISATFEQNTTKKSYFHGNLEPVNRSNASMYFSRVREITSGGSSGGELFLFQVVDSRYSRTNCLSNEP